ncbi:MAG: helix-hairpin-helix domain-containing protein [Myxococcales bacterium]|nr:helix-hairpin-helix domain-containing protein [Myxococcales bacterium]
MKSLSDVRAALAALVFVGALFAPTEARAQARSTQQRPAASATASAAQTPSVEGVVNINTATEDELRRLPLVGPARATAIVALRARVQRFRSPDDLQRVRGIGRASMRRIRPYVTLTGDTTLLARPGRAPRATQPRASAPVSQP